MTPTPLTTTDPFTAQVHARLDEQARLEAQIAARDAEVATLPQELAALAGHPVLWLLLGREGVDRPGTMGSLVGQQVVTIVRRDRRSLLLVGLLALLIGLVLGASGVYLWGGI